MIAIKCPVLGNAPLPTGQCTTGLLEWGMLDVVMTLRALDVLVRLLVGMFMVHIDYIVMFRVARNILRHKVLELYSASYTSVAILAQAILKSLLPR